MIIYREGFVVLCREMQQDPTCDVIVVRGDDGQPVSFAIPKGHAVNLGDRISVSFTFHSEASRAQA